jgi:hypothetical protein
LTVILLVATTFNSDILKFIPLELMLAVSALSFLLITVHLETRLTSMTDELQTLSVAVQKLENTQRDHLTAITPPIQTKTLAQAFDAVSRKRTRWGRLRIFAVTTHQICTFFSSHEFAVEQCDILLHQRTSSGNRRSSDNLRPDLTDHTDYLVELWRSLEKEGRIGALTVRSYNFLPMNYECIFDDEILLLGLYEPDPDNPIEVKVGSVTIVENNTPQGQRVIEEYQKRYDKLFEVCANNHGPNPYDQPKTSRLPPVGHNFVPANEEDMGS